jgi:KDO2-lipid IV(A) lauroyltransferase
MVFEMPRIWLGQLPDCDIVGAVAEQAYARGKGIVFLTPHLGCFEMSVQAAARRSDRHGAITVLYRPHARAGWPKFWKPRAIVRRAGRAHHPGGRASDDQGLRQGAAVGLLPDQVPPKGWASGRLFSVAMPIR